MSEPNSRDREVAAGVCTRRADEPFAATCIAAYRVAIERDECRRVLDAVRAELHEFWKPDEVGNTMGAIEDRLAGVR